MLKLIECPRDAMQGLHDFIPTEMKANYINQLLKVGFDTIDFGSFVSPKAIPQMRDTAEVLSKLELDTTISKLLSIVVNKRGAEDAAQFEEIAYFGFPFSISQTFQIRNTNSTIEESFDRVKDIQDICVSNGKQLVVYLSMAFGNPYGDPWDTEIAAHWGARLHNELGVNILALGDTIGVSNRDNITKMFTDLMRELPNVEIGAHLHSTPTSVHEKVSAAYEAGCRRFDGAIKGFGGCPMAKDDLTGNMPTEGMMAYFNENKIGTNIDQNEFSIAMEMAAEVFPK
ncbi:MAG: hydroxymethylglutaryl-CoA lyase [Crocinitomicaceae bacterium]|nr:hydroxymethylglutaryl-CoA lyase [Crocinitomicaceae bacterium]